MAVKIEQLYPSSQGQVVAITGFDGLVQVLDIAADVVVARMMTVYQVGGNRIAVSSDAAHLFAAGYEAGVEAYHCRSGITEWSRVDLRGVHNLKLSPGENSLYCLFESGPCVELDARTGETMRRIRGVRRIWHSRFDQIEVTYGKDFIIYDQAGQRLGRIPFFASALPRLAFAPNEILVALSYGSHRLYKSGSWTEIWCSRPDVVGFLADVTYCLEDQTYRTLAYPAEFSPTCGLVELNGMDGSLKTITTVESEADPRFIDGGARIITSFGQILDGRSGVPLGTSKAWPH